MDQSEAAVAERMRRLVERFPKSQPPMLRPPWRQLVPLLAAATLGFLLVIAALGRFGSPVTAIIGVSNLSLIVETEADWDPLVSQTGAESAALAKTRELAPAVTGLRVVSVREVAGIRSVTDAEGDRRFESTDPVDAWVFLITGNSGHFTSVSGWALIDAKSGAVIAAGVAQRND